MIHPLDIITNSNHIPQTCNHFISCLRVKSYKSHWFPISPCKYMPLMAVVSDEAAANTAPGVPVCRELRNVKQWVCAMNEAQSGLIRSLCLVSALEHEETPKRLVILVSQPETAQCLLLRTMIFHITQWDFGLDWTACVNYCQCWQE